MALIATMIACFVALLAAGSADVAAVFAARQKAILAAEFAALAAADATTWMNDFPPQEEADRVATSNGAVLVSCTCRENSNEVEVTVRVRPDLRLVSAWFGSDVFATRVASVQEWVPTWAP